MIRKIILLILLCVCFQNIVKAQTLDSVTISLIPYTDTSCYGSQLRFTAVQSNDTFSTTSYHWYTNNMYTGITIDTFYTTALNSGDSVYCTIYYTDSSGTLDSARSNTIIIYRSSSIPPKAIIALTTGNNPDCGGHPLTFTVFPVNGGITPIYQWMVNDTAVAGADSTTFTGIFPGGDSISCMMVSNSSCAPFDTAYSNKIPILNYHDTASIITVIARDTICAGAPDTLTALLTNPGNGYTIEWFIDTNIVPSALGDVYITDSLHNGELVYSILISPDSCIVNNTALSNIVTAHTVADLPSSVSIALTQGTNPGCIDSPVTFTATYFNFGTDPSLTWYINGIPEGDSSSFTTTYLNNDVLTFRIRATDNGCYVNDSLLVPGVILERDSTPPAPLISLIGNELVGNTFATYSWYDSSTGLIPGAISKIYHPNTLGYYWATIDSANCPSLPSNVIFISLLEVSTISNVANISIYPNPTSGILNIDFGSTTVNMQLDICNILGQTVMHEEINNQTHHSTDISRLTGGTYLVILKDSNGIASTFKILLGK